MWCEKGEILRTCGMHAAVNSERWRCLLNRFGQARVERCVANERWNIAENLEFHFGAISDCDIFHDFANAADELRAQIVVENAQRSLHGGGLRNNVERAACRKLADGERRFLVGWHFARDQFLQREVDVHGGIDRIDAEGWHGAVGALAGEGDLESIDGCVRHIAVSNEADWRDDATCVATAASTCGDSSTPSLMQASAPLNVSSPGWESNFTVPQSSDSCALRSFAAPSSEAVCIS